MSEPLRVADTDDDLDAEVHAMLRWRLDFLRRGPSLPYKSEVNALELLLPHGLTCTPQRRPKGIRKRADKNCYCNAFNVAHERGFVYIEGLGWDRRDPSMLAPHAWCVNEALRVVDPTWRDPDQRAYVGIPFDLRAVEDLFCRDFGGYYQSIVDHVVSRGQGELERIVHPRFRDRVLTKH